VRQQHLGIDAVLSGRDQGDGARSPSASSRSPRAAAGSITQQVSTLTTSPSRTFSASDKAIAPRSAAAHRHVLAVHGTELSDYLGYSTGSSHPADQAYNFVQQKDAPKGLLDSDTVGHTNGSPSRPRRSHVRYDAE